MACQTDLKKASLSEITAGKNPTVVKDTCIDVQFNPASLKLSLTSHSSAHPVAQQRRQHIGIASSTLTFDLHFDTADEGTTAKPVSVRGRTAAVERFLIPKSKGNQKQAPPKARFIWGDLKFDGLIDDLTIDFDLFAANGTPLRAKMTVVMKEQDPRYELGQLGSAANNDSSATDPGTTGTGPASNSDTPGPGAVGSTGPGPTDTTATAIGGESAADFAARANLDPNAWRAIAGKLGGASPISLPAGLEIDFSAAASASAGLGTSVGAEGGASLSVEATFGLDANAAGVTAGPGASAAAAAGASLNGATAAGFALAAAGGVSAALDAVSIVRASAAVTSTMTAFGAPSAAAATTAVMPNGSAQASAPLVSASPAPPAQSRTPLRFGDSFVTPPATEPSAPSPLRVDPRAATYGFGVPLRPRRGNAADVRIGEVGGGRISLQPRARPTDALTPGDPTVAPWTRLPVDPGRVIADQFQQTRTPPPVCVLSATAVSRRLTIQPAAVDLPPLRARVRQTTRVSPRPAGGGCGCGSVGTSGGKR